MGRARLTADVATVVIGRLRKATEAVERSAVERLEYVGEQSVDTARATGSYHDRTGNLRNSIGYAVARRGQVEAQRTLQGPGGDAAKALLERLDEGDAKTLRLRVVAGMEYGPYVEALGFTVLQQARAEAAPLAKQMLEGIIDDIPDKP